MTTITEAAPIYQGSVRPRTWEDEAFHHGRQSDKSVASPPSRVYDSRMVFHTVWRTDAPKGYTTMKVEAAEPISVARAKREPKVNPFDAHIVAFNEAYSVSDKPGEGKAGRITLDEGDTLSTVVRNLRKAAAKIGRSVIFSYDGDAKTATTFRFQLKAKVAPKGTKTAVEAATVAPATPAKSTTPTKSGKRK